MEQINSNSPQTFLFEGQNVRTVMKDGEPWWVLKDVCDVLGLSNPTVIAERLDEDERAKLSLGRQGKANIVNESGLYRVIMRSDKPNAKQFKRWITHEVLPQIRSYLHNNGEDKGEMMRGRPAIITCLNEDGKADVGISDINSNRIPSSVVFPQISKEVDMRNNNNKYLNNIQQKNEEKDMTIENKKQIECMVSQPDENEPQVLFYEGCQVRTVQIDGEIWWVLKDVCDVLGLSNPTVIAERLDEDERAKLSLGRQGETNIVNESGLYRVIMRSDKPNAKQFTRWVTHEVLPQIRKHGTYVTKEKLEEFIDNPENMVKVLKKLIQERAEKRRVQAEKERVEYENDQLQTEKVELQLQLDNAQPQILFAHAVSASEGTILIGELAKILKGNGINIGQNRLFERLRDEGFLMKRKGTIHNVPTQRAMELGLFKVKETVVMHTNKSPEVVPTVKVTGKGQLYFIKYFLDN